MNNTTSATGLIIAFVFFVIIALVIKKSTKLGGHTKRTFIEINNKMEEKALTNGENRVGDDWKRDIHIIRKWIQFIGGVTVASIIISVIASFVIILGAK